MIQDLAVAALGRQPRLHRPEPVVRPLRRRGPPRLPALRPRPGARRRLRQGARDGARSCARRSTRWACPSYAKTTGSRGIHVYVPIVRGPTQKQVWTFAKAFAQTLASRAPELITAEYQVAKRPDGPRARRLQPERLGPHARVDLLGAAHAARDGLDAGHLGGGRARRRDRGLPHRQRAGARRASSATSGSRCSPPAGVSTWSGCCDAPTKVGM